MAATEVALAKPMRCAVYTRKSTDEGLNQEFNSLDAQREAAEAFIVSQRSNGWTLVPTLYSDGGYTGANIERPGMQRLLADIEEGQIDCVVVYKVDRLSRSLVDFAKMMDLFERRGVSFVSVTQQFNTNTSLGRLTLNILLSFAQFEREIISERTRDKQVAARRKGKWTGGHVLLGYDLAPGGGKLVVNAAEAEWVRQIYRWYLEDVPVAEIARRLDQLGLANKQWTTKEGKSYGGRPLRRCHIYSLLANPLYTGWLKAGETLVAGEQEAIVDQTTFAKAQEKLQKRGRRTSYQRAKRESLLQGMLWCACGARMYPTYVVRQARRYRYYFCQRAQLRNGACSAKWIAAGAIEHAVVGSIQGVASHPEVLMEVERFSRELNSQDVTSGQGELRSLNSRIKNLKSQVARNRSQDSDLRGKLRDQVGQLELAAASMRDRIAGLKQCQVGRVDSPRQEFSQLWEEMRFDEQRAILEQLVDRVICGGPGAKLVVRFRASSSHRKSRKLCFSVKVKYRQSVCYGLYAN